MNPHYLSLFVAYSVATALWFLCYKVYPSIWDTDDKISFEKPSLEFVYGILAVFTIIGIGQLYIHGLLIPNNGNKWVDALNQMLIFSPTLMLLFIRKQKLETIWLPQSKIWNRLLIGLVIAFGSLIAYWISRKEAAGFGVMLSDIFHFKNISHLVQVFLEDITIALLFLRFAAWVGTKWSILLVASLFAAGHVPSLLADGATLIEMSNLIMDTFLGIIVLTALSKSKDVWWFFIVHFVLDMTQYYGG